MLKERGRVPWSLHPGGAAKDAELEEIARRAAERGLPEVRYDPGWPADSYSLIPARAAVFAKEAGKVVSFSQAALRQRFAAGRDLSELDNVLIAAAACELHPRAVIKGIETKSVKDRWQPLRRPRSSLESRGYRPWPSAASSSGATTVSRRRSSRRRAAAAWPQAIGRARIAGGSLSTTARPPLIVAISSRNSLRRLGPDLAAYGCTGDVRADRAGAGGGIRNAGVAEAVGESAGGWRRQCFR